ncbi:cache domain-containing sensor histidine kinase [Gracilibacillus suaedae]|uniref:cache domain-containing sensor histidine kinase n=1 Tax=Gracilibacillus suaedae TaxID=2820273 RepID=UPI001ABDE1A9|nr:sensor histidine kinase [Gracilibacillus suaedae]
MNKLLQKLDQWTSHIMIRPKLLITFYLVSFTPILLVSYFFYISSSQTLKDELGKYMVETSRQVDLRLDAFIEEMEYLALSIQNDQDVQRFLNLQDQTDPMYLDMQLDLRDLLATTVDYRDHLWSVFVVNDYGSILYYSKPSTNPLFSSWWSAVEIDDAFLTENQMYQKIKEEKEFALYPPHSASFTNDEQVVTFGGRMYQLTKEKGTLLFNFDPSFISQMSDMVQIGDTGFVSVLTSGDKLLFENENIPSSFLKRLKDLNLENQYSGYGIINLENKETLISFTTSDKTGWKILSVVPFEEVSGNISAVRNSIYFIATNAILFVILFSKYLSQLITNPLVELQNYMLKAETGDLSVRVPVLRSDEYGKLTKTFNRMLQNLESLKNRVYDSKIQEIKLRLLHRESEFRALQMQINPHFLYNTLNTMKCIGEIKEIEEVTEMSDALSSMFQYSIDNQNYKTIEEELNHVNAYLRIIQIRFPGKIQYGINCSGHLQNIYILKLILQPLVENAVEHGIIPSGKQGTLNITVREDDDKYLTIKVIDNGVGMSQEKMELLNRKLTCHETNASNEELPSNSIGLYNVQQRLLFNYEGKSFLTIDSKEGQGTIITIKIPIENERNEP